ncbi:MAG TPA: energy transducer TonB [Candidatus Koribacter sp.]|jgi:TonB family protein
MKAFRPSRIEKWLALLLVGLMLAGVLVAQTSQGDRKVRNKVFPVYPELAKKLKLVATVKVQVTISPSGNVTQAKAIGGHPLLIAPSVDAAKLWRYEPGPDATTTVIEFHFSPDN